MHLTRIIFNKFKLPDLPYDYNALEPIISAEIMQLHHGKHHQAYVNNLNLALEKIEEAKNQKDLKTIISLESSIRFNGGGHINHTIFWENLSPPGKNGEPNNDLMKSIKESFGSLDNLKENLSKKAINLQGSGWAWLGICLNSGQLQTKICPNQDPLESTTGLIPLFGIDVWEHAYYLQYKNVRADYVKAIWNIANWNDIGKRFMAVKQKLPQQ